MKSTNKSLSSKKNKKKKQLSKEANEDDQQWKEQILPQSYWT